jgi:uncharacterized caspase-like protein
MSPRRRACLGTALGTALATDWAGLALAQAQNQARSASRQALVIGNGAYPTLPLRNPGNDARAVSQALRSLGFETQLLLDAGWRQMIEDVQSFVTRTERAEVRLLYYAGHGAQLRGRNHLIPVDAPMTSADELTTRSLDAGEVLERLGRQRSGMTLLILDACRDNPASQYQLLPDGRRIKVRGSAKGLATMNAPKGSLVAFSTAPGSVADDGPGRGNSLYTRHLLRHIATPGIALEQMFKRVRVGVMQDSGERQRPWEESSLTLDYCLAGC